MSANEYLTNWKVGAAVSTGTTGTSVASILDAIPNDLIVKSSLILGLVLTIILIIANLLKLISDRRKSKIEIETLQLVLNEKQRADLEKTKVKVEENK